MILNDIQPYLSNRLDSSADTHKWVAGIIGDRPSLYAKSPSLWNHAFRTLELDAVYLPFDVEAANLSSVLKVLRQSNEVLGFNVTVPYKVQIISFLDELDAKATQIGAVNTVTRTQEGKLVGHNTDGQGFMDMLTKALPGETVPFLEEITGRHAVLIGAGGAARAVAFFLAEALGNNGRLTIVNRDPSKGQELARSVNKVYSNAAYMDESDMPSEVSKADFIINATTKGQSGIRKLGAGRVTCLEPYSALAPACPAELSENLFSTESAFYAAWYLQSYQDIEANFSLTNKILTRVPPETVFVDLIYSPLETRTLATARLMGHRTLNGKGMNISQAADAFVNHVMSPYLNSLGWDLQDTYRRVSQVMTQIW